jgi:hypothetical protein
MEGAVITDLFESPIYFETEGASAGSERRPDDQDVYSQEEQRLLTERLADLGYLE